MHTSLTRVISTIVLVTFTSFTLLPLQVGAQTKLAQAKAIKGTTRPTGANEQYATLLDQIKETVKQVAAKAKNGANTQTDAQTLRSQIQQLQALDSQVDQAFAATEADLKAKNLPAEILARHQGAVADFNAKRAAFKQQLNALDAASTASTNASAQVNGLNKLSTWLDENQPSKAQIKTDPNKLPFRNSNGKVRAPIESEQGYTAKLSMFGQKPVHLAGPIPAGGIRFAKALDPKAQPTADDLAATIDVQLTPAIRAKAAEFGNNPVQIHNWVTSNIEFLPTYGSIQGSDLTLQTKHGNAFDIASLEIALMRSVGIPSRYVYGTIQMPAERAVNWISGITTPEATLNLLAQGGIPSIGLYSGGKISAIRMEHVWVEAYVDYVPSRGAVNKNPNTWVPMDASFKQYANSSPKLVLQDKVPFDYSGFASDLRQGMTATADGGVAGLYPDYVNKRLTDYYSNINTYFAAHPDANIGDIFPSRTIIKQDHTILAGTMPYKVLATAASFTQIPSSLRHEITISQYMSDYDRAMDAATLTATVSLPALAAHRLHVRYEAASAADQTAWDSFKSSGATRLPLYAIHVVPKLYLDDTLLAQGSATAMGQNHEWTAALTFPGIDGLSMPEVFQITSGDEFVFGVDSAGYTPDVVSARLQSVPANTVKEDLHQAALNYWAQWDMIDRVLGAQMGVVPVRLPSVGVFSSPLTAFKMFGIPMRGTYNTWRTDIAHSAKSSEAVDNEVLLHFRTQSGWIGSYLEGSVYDQLFGQLQGHGQSAAQVMIDAMKQQIPIYKIDETNVDAILPTISLSADSQDDIRNGVTNGKVVFVPKSRPGTTGGYVMLDPATGAGAYMIEGGFHGGASDECQEEAEPQPVKVHVTILQWTVIALMVVLLIGVAGPAVLTMMASFSAQFGAILGTLLKVMTLPLLFMMGNAYAGPKTLCCDPVALAHHRGGETYPHDWCADNRVLPGGNEAYGGDVLVNGKSFDAITNAHEWLWEVKTQNPDNWSGGGIFYRTFILPGDIADIRAEMEIAQSCHYEQFSVLVGSREYGDMLVAGVGFDLGSLDVRLDSQCLRRK